VGFTPIPRSGPATAPAAWLEPQGANQKAISKVCLRIHDLLCRFMAATLLPVKPRWQQYLENPEAASRRVNYSERERFGKTQ
jgi:hypothetical protein